MRFRQSGNSPSATAEQSADLPGSEPVFTADGAPPDVDVPAYEKPTRIDLRQNAAAGGPPLAHPGLNIGAGTPTSQKVQPLLDEALNYCEVSQEFWQKGELDNALEALDQAYRLILEVDTSDRPKLIQQKEDLRFLISKRILEIYASRNIVVNGNHNAIPIVVNKYVQAEIDRFTKGHERNFFIESFVRSGRYRPQIIAELKKAGLPTELSWLPLIESGFKVKALSRARALGLWQFIPSTGYKFGLSRDKYVDERLDPDEATQAAIAYLKELHQIFGDWTTVLAAYNCGEGRVLRVIREQNVNYLDNFWDLYERLPYETARYVPRFLATLHIMENLERYGFDQITVDPPIEHETLEVQKQVHLKHVAAAIGTTESHLIALNPELRYKILPPETYQLKVPPDTGHLLLSKLDTIPESKLPTRPFVYHRVRRGETLSIIARKYRTRVRTIMRANNLRSSHYIVAGRLLKIPTRGYAYRPAKPARSSVGKATKHLVRRGDNLWNIAKRYGTTTTKIQELNNLTDTELHIGQVLKLPGNTRLSARDRGYKVYQVKSGDSPFTIAQRHNMPLNRFLRINRLSSRSTIFPGQKLYVE
jgi:membrane-bound lytic murein transglycosylase D